MLNIHTLLLFIALHLISLNLLHADYAPTSGPKKRCKKDIDCDCDPKENSDCEPDLVCVQDPEEEDPEQVCAFWTCGPDAKDPDCSKFDEKNACVGQHFMHCANGIGMDEWKSEKFKKCCEQAEIEPYYICQYPPPELTEADKDKLPNFINEYIDCFADGSNNVLCCNEKGVPDRLETVWKEFKYINCQDLCMGERSQISMSGIFAKYDGCAKYRALISECNEKNAKKGPTAAERFGHCYSADPALCTNKNPHENIELPSNMSKIKH